MNGSLDRPGQREAYRLGFDILLALPAVKATLNHIEHGVYTWISRVRGGFPLPAGVKTPTSSTGATSEFSKRLPGIDLRHLTERQSGLPERV